MKLPFCIENQCNFFYWKSIDFCPQHFSTENLYKIFYWIYSKFWTCDFVLKTNTNVSIENQKFFMIIFLLEINTKFPIQFTVHFELLFDDRKAPFCVENQYNWKSVCFRTHHISVFIDKIAKIFTVKITKIYVVKMSDWNYDFYWFCYYFWNCHFLILNTNTKFHCKQKIFTSFNFSWKSIHIHFSIRIVVLNSSIHMLSSNFWV